LTRLLAVTLLAALPFVPRPMAGQEDVADPRTAEGTTAVKTVVAITPDRRAGALKFAELHHPELAELLLRLEPRNPREFDKAVRQIFIVSDRLARLKARDEARYELQLETWKLDSRIKLLAARLVMGPDDDHEAELRNLIEQRLDLRLRQQTLDRDQLAERIRKLDESIAEAATDRDATIERELRRIRAGVKSTPVRTTPVKTIPARDRPKPKP
jgi:hypothetical protein